MTTFKNQNFRTTLGLILGLIIVGAVLPVAGQGTQASADQFGIYINKRPLKDFARNTVVKIESKKVDLDAAFKVTIKATVGLATDGKTYILKKPTLVPGGNTGDPAMQKLAQDAILAIGDAGWFGYLMMPQLRRSDVPAITIEAEQNETQFQAKIAVEQRDKNSAMTISSGLQGMLMMAGQVAQGDEAIFLKFTRASSEGKDLHVTMAAPKEIIAGMIQRELAKQKEAAK